MKRRWWVWATLCFLLAGGSSQAQTVPADTTRQRSSELDTLVTYQAKIQDNWVDKRITVLEGDAEVHYQNMTLKAGRITLYWDEHLLVAEGIPDTVWEPTPDGTDSVQVVRIKGEPVFSDGSEELRGSKMTYNFKTRRGRVIRGRTQFEGGRYVGATIKREGDKVIWVANGSYTTCDLDEPHYRFASAKMKLIVNDKAIAKPLVMYLGHVPIAALPFAIFPHKHGRQSGLLIPHYGESELEGRYLRGLGYYWAPNDYFDAKGSVDFFERSGWMFHLGSNYAVRYLLRGTVSGSFTRKNYLGGRKVRRWDLAIRHSQNLDPNASFNVNGYFVSDKDFYRDYSANLDQRLRRQLQSNATFSRNWPGSRNSLTVNISQTRDLDTDNSILMLPQVSFRHAQRRLFGKKRHHGRTRWYETIYYAYSSRLVNRLERRTVTWPTPSVQETQTRQIRHNFTLSWTSPRKLFGWLQWSQGLNVAEDWFDRRKDYRFDPDSGAVVSTEQKGFFPRHTFSYRFSANTKLYGLFTPRLGSVEAIRHVVTPSLSFNFTPDFSDPRWGYYQVVRDSLGQEMLYDRFVGTPQGGAKAIYGSVRNLFQAKVLHGEEEKKLDLLSWDVSLGYNFKARGQKLSELRSSVRTLFLRSLNLTLNMSHSFYEAPTSYGDLPTQYLWEDGGWKRGHFMRLTYFRLSTGFRLSGKARKQAGTEEGEAPEATALEEESPAFPQIVLPGERFNPERSFQDFRFSWRASVSLNLELDKRGLVPRKRYYARIYGVEVQLTKNWRLAYSAQLDLLNREIVHQRFTFHRDLHCWEAEFDWVPSGRDRRYYLRINIKAPQLRQLKLEKRGGRAGFLGYGSYYY
ncbi:MAG: LPS-assembly protein LptD [Calditrichaeota bacterium]|nr:LPS-assembly protein LptD [Calditrichota bacterium]